MELIELSEKKFEQFAGKHQYATFYQTKEYFLLKHGADITAFIKTQKNILKKVK